MSTQQTTHPWYVVDARYGFCEHCGRRELLTVAAQDDDSDRERRFCSASCWYRHELRSRTGGEAA